MVPVTWMLANPRWSRSGVAPAGTRRKTGGYRWRSRRVVPEKPASRAFRHGPVSREPRGFRSAGRLRQRYPSVWLIPLAPDDQHLVGGGLEGEAQAEQAVEGGGGRAAPGEPAHELVEVGLQVLL